MKTMKKTLIGALGALSFACTLFAVSACEMITKQYYTVTPQFDDEKGTVTISAAASTEGYALGEEVTVTVMANEGYEIGVVTVNDAAVNLDTNGKYTFEVEGNTTVEADFTVAAEPEPTYYTVTPQFDAEKGDLAISAPASAKGYIAGETVTLTVTAKENYEIDAVTVNGAAVTLNGEGKYTFTITGNTTVAATFTQAAQPEPTYYTVTPQFDAEKGDLTISAPASAKGYIEGERVTLTVTAKEDYEIGAVTVNGTPVTLDGEGKYTFTITGDTTVEATFTEATTGFPAAYQHTWQKIYSSSPSFAATLTITEDTLTYNGKTYETTKEADGTYSFRTPFAASIGFLDSAKTILWLREGSLYMLFTADGQTPTAFAPAAVRNTSWDGVNFGRLAFDNNGALTIQGTSITEQAAIFLSETTATGATFYALYNNNIWKFDYVAEPEALTLEIGGITYPLTKVAAVDLPAAYQGTWKLAGQPDITIDANGKLTYGGTEVDVFSTAGQPYEYTFTSEDTTYGLGLAYPNNIDREAANVKWFVLMVIDLDGEEAAYYTRDGETLPTMPIPVNTFDGTWTEQNGATLTIENGLLTLNGETASLYGWEQDIMSYMAWIFVGGAYYDVTFSSSSITLMGYNIEETFTKAGGGTHTGTEFPFELQGTWNEYAATGARTLTIDATTIKLTDNGDQTDLTAAATLTGTTSADYAISVTIGGVKYTLTLTQDLGGYNNAIAMTDGDVYTFFINSFADAMTAPEALYDTTWEDTNQQAPTLTIDGEGNVKVGDAETYILSIQGTAAWTMLVDGFGAWYNVTVEGDTLTCTDITSNPVTFTKKAGGTHTGTEFPSELQGTWNEYTKTGARTLKIDATTIKLTVNGEEKDLTAGATVTGDTFADVAISVTIDGKAYTLKLTQDFGGEFNVIAMQDEDDNFNFFINSYAIEKTAPEAVYNTTWENTSQSITLTIDGEGNVKVGDAETYVLSIRSFRIEEWTMLVDGFGWYTVAVEGDTLTCTDILGNPITFTKKESGGTHTQITIPDEFQGEWNEYTKTGARTLKLDASTIKLTVNGEEKDLTAGATIEGTSAANYALSVTIDGKAYTLKLTQDLNAYNAIAMSDGDINTFFINSYADEKTAPATLYNTTWENTDAEITLTIDAEGYVTVNGAETYILSFQNLAAFHGTTGWTMLVDGFGAWYNVTVGENALTCTDFDGNPITLTKKDQQGQNDFTVPGGMGGTWYSIWNGAVDTDLSAALIIDAKNKTVTLPMGELTDLSSAEETIMGKLYGMAFTIKYIDDNTLEVTSEGITQYYYSDETSKPIELSCTAYNGTWTGANGETLIVTCADNTVTLNGKTAVVTSFLYGFSGVAGFTMVVPVNGTDTWYSVTLSGGTITLTAADGTETTLTASNT